PRTLDSGGPGAVHSRHRAPVAPIASSSTRRECSPLPRRGCPIRGAPPIGPRRSAIRLPGAAPLLPRDGIEVPHAVLLPCQNVVSTIAAYERRTSWRLLIN